MPYALYHELLVDASRVLLVLLARALAARAPRVHWEQSVSISSGAWPVPFSVLVTFTARGSLVGAFACIGRACHVSPGDPT
eukprot:COSAG02_NODE_331_length_24480_cov_22.114720_14_plen_81_part_00